MTPGERESEPGREPGAAPAAERPVLVATLGPACQRREILAAFHEAGADRLRLNGSHLDEAGLLQAIRRASEAGFPPHRVVVDLQGGKPRLGHLAGPFEVMPGDRLSLVPSATALGRVLPVDRAAFLDGVRPGDRIRIDDGRVRLRVCAVRGEGRNRRISCEVEGSGRIRSRKGLALVGRTAPMPGTLLERDRRLLAVARERGVRCFALSYAHVPGLLAELRRHGGSGIRVAAKIEHPWAVRELDRLAAQADELWLCRGDLGAEAGLLELPRLQRRVVEALPLPCPLLVAGHVLPCLERSDEPGRSEACHLADLVVRGIDGVVLSDETAVGRNGVRAVWWARQIMRRAG